MNCSRSHEPGILLKRQNTLTRSEAPVRRDDSVQQPFDVGNDALDQKKARKVRKCLQDMCMLLRFVSIYVCAECFLIFTAELTCFSQCIIGGEIFRVSYIFECVI